MYKITPAGAPQKNPIKNPTLPKTYPKKYSKIFPKKIILATQKKRTKKANPKLELPPEEAFGQSKYSCTPAWENI